MEVTMEELVIRQAGSYLDNICHFSHVVELLAKNNSMEIMLHKIEERARAVLSSHESEGLMEFFYIIDGEIICEYENISKALKAGDYFYVSNLTQKVYLKANKKAQILYVATKPVYNSMSDIVSELENIMNMIMKKDMYTYEHNNRLHNYSIQMAEKLNLSKDEMEKLLFAARFHDIGKINVPDYILQKPGMLNEDELRYIRLHPADGKKIVSGTYINRIGNIIEQHHERLDGSGYPYGLKGEEILWEAKIIAVADSYDAMTTDRPYRKAMEPNTAMQELERLAGIHYEKNVVEVFKSLLIEQGVIESQVI
jgi:HD-GYP domain-containing protein (c-di-GMP phosphodiesterase class II)